MPTIQEEIIELKKIIKGLSDKVSVLENKIQGEGKVVLSKKELRIDRSTSISEILNFKDTVNSIIDLSVPGDGKFLRATGGKYIGSVLSMADILAGSLTQGYVPYFNTTAWANSPILISATNVGIGATTPDPNFKLNLVGAFLSSSLNEALASDVTGLCGNPPFCLVANNSSADGNINVAIGANAIGAHLYGLKTRSNHTDANTAVVANDELLSLFSFGADGAAYRAAGGIKVLCDGAVSSAIVPGRLVFYTTDTAGSSTERMRIASTGYIGIKNAAPNYILSLGEAAGKISFARGSGEADYGLLGFIGTTGNDRYCLELKNSSGTGEIRINQSSGSAPIGISLWTTPTGGSSTQRMLIDKDGKVTVVGAFGCNGAAAQTAYASGGAVTTSAGDFGFASDAERASLTTLVANIRLALIAIGIMS